MCLLIIKPAGASLKREWLIHGAKGNPQGSGAAWVQKEGLHHCRGIYDEEQFADFCMEHVTTDRPGIIHFRLATHGNKGKENCHPFQLNNGWMMAHNGIISGLEHPEKSDTAMYAEIIKARMDLDEHHLDRPDTLEQMEIECAGSKLGFIHRTGRFLIVNECLGDWEGGVWFSNNGHKPPQYDWEGGVWFSNNGHKPPQYDWEEWSHFRSSRGYYYKGKHYSYYSEINDKKDTSYTKDNLLCGQCYTPLATESEMDDDGEPICKECYYWNMQSK